MRFRYKIIKATIDLLILCVGLWLIYLSAYPGDWAAWLATDGLGVLIIVFAAYLGTIAFIELLLVYMRQDTWFAKIVKSFVAILLVITIFPVLLFGLLWLFGYGIEGDVVPVLMWIAIIRSLVGVWLGRLFEKRSV